MNLVDQLEALIFVTEAPVRIADLVRVLGVPEGTVEQGLELLAERHADSGALKLVKLAGGYQFATKPEHAELVANYLQPQRSKMSRSVMEVLAVIAYRQPVTVADIEVVRGVQSDYGVRILAERNLICEVGRLDRPGRPVLWGTTAQFLHQFNLPDKESLPKLELGGLPPTAHDQTPLLMEESD
jgi:segregation and condensation protein B